MRNCYRVVFVLLALLLAGLPSDSAQPGQLAEMKATYSQEIRAYATVARMEKEKALAGYRSALEIVAARYQDEGALDELLGIRNELSRLSNEKKAPDSIPDGSPSMMGAALSYYDREVAEIERQKGEKSDELTRKYHAALSGLMKAFTRENKISEALEVRKELKQLDEKVDKLPPPMVTKEFPCTACGGTGRTESAKCPGCGGSGKCESCDGKGKRPNIINKDQLVMCIHCRGTGKCKNCEGSGTRDGRCFPCKGRGKVFRRIREGSDISVRDAGDGPDLSDDVAEGPLEQADDGAQVARPGPSAIAREMDNYVKTLASLNEMNRLNRVSKESFGKVLASQGGYIGKLMESNVDLMWAFPRGVEVRSGANSEAVTLVPVSLRVGRAAEQFHKSLGKGAKVSIRYGVVNEKNLTLFGISRAK